MVELGCGGKSRCPCWVSGGRGDPGEAEDRLHHGSLVADLFREAQARACVRLRVFPAPFAVCDQGEPSVCEAEVPLVADCACDLGCLGVEGRRATGITLTERTVCEVVQRQGDARHVAEAPAQLKALLEVRGYSLRVPEQVVGRTEIVERGREHVVVPCLASEADRLVEDRERRLDIGSTVSGPG